MTMSLPQHGLQRPAPGPGPRGAGAAAGGAKWLCSAPLVVRGIEVVRCAALPYLCQLARNRQKHAKVGHGSFLSAAFRNELWHF